MFFTKSLNKFKFIHIALLNKKLLLKIGQIIKFVWNVATGFILITIPVSCNVYVFSFRLFFSSFLCCKICSIVLSLLASGATD